MWDLIVSVPGHCLSFYFGFGGRMWDLIVSVPGHCLSFYFGKNQRCRLKMFTTDNECWFT